MNGISFDQAHLLTQGLIWAAGIVAAMGALGAAIAVVDLISFVRDPLHRR